MCPPTPRFICQNPNPQSDCIRRCGLREPCPHEWDQWSYKEAHRAPKSGHRCRIPWEAGHLQPARVFPRTRPCWHPDLGCPGFRTGSNTFLLFYKPSEWTRQSKYKKYACLIQRVVSNIHWQKLSILFGALSCSWKSFLFCELLNLKKFKFNHLKNFNLKKCSIEIMQLKTFFKNPAVQWKHKATHSPSPPRPPSFSITGKERTTNWENMWPSRSRQNCPFFSLPLSPGFKILEGLS